jgi:hypothetical protein
MAVDAATTTPAPAPGHALPLVAAARAVPVKLTLGGLVGVSFALRLAAALAHATPLYFPDEYIYGTIARSIATNGRPAVRGMSAHFPALLEPLLTAPFWLTHDAELAYRLTQGLNALAMSLAAIPVFLLCRRLGLSAAFGLGAAAVAVAAPDLLFANFVLADPIAYPLALTAVWLGVRALDVPTARAQALFVAVAGLAAFARIQYVVLPAAFVAAALVLDRRAVRRYWPTAALLALPGLAVAAVGTSRVLGYYSSVGHDHVPVGSALKWAAIDTMMLAYSAGWILIPGALVGLAYALVRPRFRAERAFAAFVLFLALLLFVEAAIYAARGSTRYQERYLFSLLPLVAPLFGVYVARGWPRRAAVALIAAAMLTLASRVPLSGFTIADNKQDSPFLFAVFELERMLKSVENGSLAVALAAGALSVLAVLVVRTRRGTAVALALTIACGAAASLGAYVFDHRNAANVRHSELSNDLRWIDRSGLPHVTLVQTAGADRGDSLEQMFWNGSVDRATLLFGGLPMDAFGAAALDVSRDGRLVLGRDVVAGPLLFATYAARPQLTGAHLVGSAPGYRLYAPAGTPRLSLLGSGLYRDGWLARGGVFRVWPGPSGRSHGTLTLRLFLPPRTERTPMRFRWKGGSRVVQVPAGGSRTVTFPFAADGVWELHFSTTQTGTLGDGREISVKAGEPQLRRT